MKKVRWGLIGCGDIAQKRVAPALRDLPNVEFVAVNRARAEMAEAFAHQFGARKWYADWQALLADPDIEAVYIATPVHLHAEQTIAAAEAGKHVLCEKPMALNVAECDRMIAACEANSVKLGIAYYRHFYPVIARVKELLAVGTIGKPILAQINAFEWNAMQPDNPRYWFFTKEKSGGGPMMDFGCHRIEVLTNVFGAVVEVQAFTDNLLFAREVEDTSAAFLKFASGVRATLTVTHAAFESQDTLDIFGSQGALHIAKLNQGDLRIVTADGEQIESHPPHANIQLPSIADFTEAILLDRAPRVDGVMGREVARIEAAIYQV
jgi:predicted dehydrogenase